ncbi:MAG: winged helix-turn-helix transcriptional regulator [Candidatus Thermoplasmatota archaeon]|nr:winged helix-turn-helix transcriptional regulator [Candidatus Thermoplasmatota archaeon]MBS3790888.1 winged helix-turn-helix transcriptional regulator [Candidatus Thermoplasmatota archaeon]
MDEKEELHKEIDDLKKQIDNLEVMLQNLMNLHKNVLENVSTDTDIEERYKRMLSLYRQFGRISPSLLLKMDDPISEDIIEILFDSSPLNITQITGRLREKRGKASRHTVRDRLKKLEREGMIKRSDKGKGKNYHLTDRTIKKWAEILGITK